MAGYTLLEIMVVVVIIAILAMVAVPGLKDTLERNTKDAAMQNVITAISLARSEAVSRGRKVSMCRSTSLTACAASTGSDWDDGWIIFTDASTAGTVDAGDTIVQARAAGNHLYKITLKTNTNTNFTGDFLQFTKDGFLSNTTTGAYFKFCAKDNVATKAAAIWLSNTGRPALSVKDADGIQNDLAGANLACP